MSTIGYINVALETFGGILSLIFVLSLCITRPQKEKLERSYIRLLICNTALLFCDASAWLFKGRVSPFNIFMVRISNFLVFALGYLMLVLFTHYLISFLSTRGSDIPKAPLYAMMWLMLLALCLVVVSQFNDMYYLIDAQNLYHRQSLFWLSQLFGIVGMAINSWLLFHQRKKMRKKELCFFAVYICLPVAALLFQIVFYSIAVLYLATTICLLCIYINIQVKLAQEIVEKTLEQERGKTAIMLSQIQPHFLYNSLVGIKELCDALEQEKTSKALEHFAYYLRGNLDSLSDKQLILFSREVSHVKDYLYLEKMRFEDRLSIVWDLKFTGFMVPSITLQPMVENAVRHGITAKKGGGTITISSEATSDTVTIIVEDNGVGFDTSKAPDDERTHIGIDNVKKRLRTQCGGDLYIKSERGIGTTVKIILPRTGVLIYENYSGRR